MRYPIILADLDLFKNVWKNTAIPIWARVQPINTIAIKPGDV